MFECSKCNRQFDDSDRCKIKRSKWCKFCLSEYVRDWKRTNRQAVAVYQSRENASGVRQARNRRWRERNPEKARYAGRRRHAAMSQASGSISVESWELVLETFNRQCAYCGKHMGDASTMDHVDPLALGGKHEIDNVVPACGTCNSKKNARGPLAMVNQPWCQNP